MRISFSSKECHSHNYNLGGLIIYNLYFFTRIDIFRLEKGMSDDYLPVPEPGQKKVLPPLSKDQVEYAHELLEELHPLEKTPV